MRTILDVGGGSGALARDLQQRGFEVECVIPSAFLAEKCREKLRAGTPVHESTLQGLELGRTFDLVLFSESFQYVRPISEALDKCQSLVRPGGHLLICDCFRKDQPGRAPIKGGIRWSQFREELLGRPFQQVVDIDMTPGIAPSFDVFADMLQNLALPVSHVVADYVSSNYPLTAKILKWKFKSRLRKVEQRYFSGEISAETFSHWKSYRLMVFRSEAADSSAPA